MMTSCKRAVFILSLLLLSCAKEDHSIDVSFTGNTAAFSNNQLSDFVFIVTNQPVNGQILDLNGDGTPDTFVFPSTCASDVPANCGYQSGAASSVTLGAFPQGFQYKIIVRLRNSAGDILEEGETTFTNSKDISRLTIEL